MIDQKSRLKNQISSITQNQQKKINEIESDLNDLKQTGEIANKKDNVESLFRILIENFSSLKTELSEIKTEFGNKLSNLIVEMTELKSEIEKVGDLKNKARNHKEVFEDIKMK